MPARAVAQPGVLAFLEALRRSGGNLSRVLDGLGRYAAGGLVMPSLAAAGSGGGMSNVTIQFPGLPRSAACGRRRKWSRSCSGRRQWRKSVPAGASRSGIADGASALYPACDRRHRLQPVRGARHHHDAEPIEQAANLARDCRGALADISVAQFRQYKVSISCTDHEAPELTDVWPGQDVTITCIPGLGGRNGAGDVLTILAKVTAWNTSRDEWAAEVAWQLEAEQRAI